MFRHDHRDEAIATRVYHLTAAVFLPDDGERLEARTRHLAGGFVHVGPDAVFEGSRV